MLTQYRDFSSWRCRSRRTRRYDARSPLLYANCKKVRWKNSLFAAAAAAAEVLGVCGTGVVADDEQEELIFTDETAEAVEAAVEERAVGEEGVGDTEVCVIFVLDVGGEIEVSVTAVLDAGGDTVGGNSSSEVGESGEVGEAMKLPTDMDRTESFVGCLFGGSLTGLIGDLRAESTDSGEETTVDAVEATTEVDGVEESETTCWMGGDAAAVAGT